MVDLKTALNPNDADLLHATSGQNWIPKDPINLISPYKEKKEIDLSDADIKRKRIEEIIKGYENISSKCNELMAIIEDQCKNVTIKVDKARAYHVTEAVRRTFGTDGEEITFEMYKQAIKKMAEVTNQSLPRPIKKG
jgi:hypothetical protein